MTDLVTRARAGDGEAFRELIEPHHRELQVHCYRMLGSFTDAEDALQETMLAAWQGLDGFEALASFRTWLYGIATSRCFDVLRSGKRRSAKAWDIPGIEPPEPTRLGELTWLEPYPDALLPDVHYEKSEAISLAFVTALQLLPARQRAVLILRDVLAYHADEVAEILETTAESVNSGLKRARATMQKFTPPEREAPPAPDSSAEQALVAKFVRAFDDCDVDGLVALLTEDVRISMPPIPFEYIGQEGAARFYTSMLRAGPRYEFVVTRANGQLALGTYLLTADPEFRPASGVAVLTLRGDRISEIARFERHVIPWFDLPQELTD